MKVKKALAVIISVISAVGLSGCAGNRSSARNTRVNNETSAAFSELSDVFNEAKDTVSEAKDEVKSEVGADLGDAFAKGFKEGFENAFKDTAGYDWSSKDESKESSSKVNEAESLPEESKSENMPEESSDVVSFPDVSEPVDIAATATIRPEVKEAIDNYEVFIDDYIDFINKFTQDTTDLMLIAEYADYANKLIDMEEKFDKIEEEDLNDAESLYYAEVALRCSQKLLNAAGDMADDDTYGGENNDDLDQAFEALNGLLQGLGY